MFLIKCTQRSPYFQGEGWSARGQLKSSSSRHQTADTNWDVKCFFANTDRLLERQGRETKIGGRGGQTERKECCLLIALIHKRAPSQQSVRRSLAPHPAITPPFFPHPNPKAPPLYQHKKMQHGTFLFTLACNTPSHPTQCTHTHTHPWPPPFPPLYHLKGIWLLPSDSPRLKVPFTLPQFTKRSDYGKQKYCVRAHFFVPERRDVRDTRIAGERESLIKLHLVKQTSLHSSCQTSRIYVVVNKEWYLRELTETNLGHGRSYIIHSTPHPCTQLRFPGAVQTAAAWSHNCEDFQ